MLDRTEPFLVRARPFSRSLASLSRAGNRGVTSVTARVRELDRFGKDLPEVAKNLGLILEHIDNRDNAAEPDERSPGGKGFTGLEAVMRYIWAQQQAANVYDGNSYIVKTGTFVDPQCTRGRELRRPARRRASGVAQRLGPSRPGIDTPDPTATKRRAAKPKRKSDAKDAAPDRPATKPNAPDSGPQGPLLAPVEKLIEKLLPVVPKLPDLRLPPLPGLGSDATGSLLDYLLRNE